MTTASAWSSRSFELDLVGDQIETVDEAGADGSEPSRQATGRARARQIAYVHAVLLLVDIGQSFQPAAQELDLRRRGALLRGEHRGGIHESGAHIARDDDLDAPISAHREHGALGAETAVGRGRSAGGDDDAPRSGFCGGRNELARAVGRGRHRVVGLGAPDQREP